MRYSAEAEQRERDQQAIIDERETFIFTEDQLVSMLQGAIELYLQYRIASSEEPAKDMAILEVLQGLTADKQLADLGVTEASLQSITPRTGERNEVNENI